MYHKRKRVQYILGNFFLFDWTTWFVGNIELDPSKKTMPNLFTRPMAETSHKYM